MFVITVMAFEGGFFVLGGGGECSVEYGYKVDTEFLMTARR
jgi:hypothetical protein